MWQTSIEPADLQSALAVLLRYPDYNVLYNDYREDDYLYGGVSPTDLHITHSVYFLEQIFIPQNKSAEIVAELSRIEGLACTLVAAQRLGYHDIHITDRNATKEHAVAELLHMLALERKQATGIGDGHNDIHLFKAVEQRIAMDNAVKELKNAADLVIGSVQDDGLAEYLEKLG